MESVTGIRASPQSFAGGKPIRNSVWQSGLGPDDKPHRVKLGMLGMDRLANKILFSVSQKPEALHLKSCPSANWLDLAKMAS